MILSFYILLQILMLFVFFFAFFSKQEILWALTFILSGILMLLSFNIESTQSVFNIELQLYHFEVVSQSYPIMMGINMIFFILALGLGILDFYDKYGISTMKFNKGGN